MIAQGPEYVVNGSIGKECLEEDCEASFCRLGGGEADMLRVDGSRSRGLDVDREFGDREVAKILVETVGWVFHLMSLTDVPGTQASHFSKVFIVYSTSVIRTVRLAYFTLA